MKRPLIPLAGNTELLRITQIRASVMKEQCTWTYSAYTLLYTSLLCIYREAPTSNHVLLSCPKVGDCSSHCDKTDLSTIRSLIWNFFHFNALDFLKQKVYVSLVASASVRLTEFSLRCIADGLFELRAQMFLKVRLSSVVARLEMLPYCMDRFFSGPGNCE